MNIDGNRNESNPSVMVDESIENCLPTMLESESGLNVLDNDKNFVGVISKNNIAEILRRSKD